MPQEFSLIESGKKIYSDNDYCIHWISNFLRNIVVNNLPADCYSIDKMNDGDRILGAHTEEVAIYHKIHSKFGPNIIECGQSYVAECFCFIRAEDIQKSMNMLLEERSKKYSKFYVSTLEATPRDRMQDGTWEEQLDEYL